MSSGSHKGDSGMNYQKLIKNLVVDGHMSFSEVLDLTPLQIAALMAENTIRQAMPIQTYTGEL